MGMMINRRRAYGGSKPYDYEVEYLDSSGTQYIDTGVGEGYDSTLLNIQCDFQHLTTSGDYRWVIFDSCDDNSYMGIQRNGVFCYIGGSQNKGVGTITNLKRTYHFDGYIEGIGNKAYTRNSCTLTNTIRLFGMRSISNCESCRIWFFRITYNNTIVRDLIPVVDKQGVGCMYDKVSKQLFYNQGTGNFIVGPRVS